MSKEVMWHKGDKLRVIDKGGSVRRDDNGEIFYRLEDGEIVTCSMDVEPRTYTLVRVTKSNGEKAGMFAQRFELYEESLKPIYIVAYAPKGVPHLGGAGMKDTYEEAEQLLKFCGEGYILYELKAVATAEMDRVERTIVENKLVIKKV